MSTKQPWDADCDATKAGLERFMRALVITKSHFTDSFSLAPVSTPQRGVSVFFRVWIPEGREQAFLQAALVDELKPPPVVDTGWTYDEPERKPEPRRERVVRNNVLVAKDVNEP